MFEAFQFAKPVNTFYIAEVVFTPPQHIIRAGVLVYPGKPNIKIHSYNTCTKCPKLHVRTRHIQNEGTGFNTSRSVRVRSLGRFEKLTEKKTVAPFTVFYHMHEQRFLAKNEGEELFILLF